MSLISQQKFKFQNQIQKMGDKLKCDSSVNGRWTKQQHEKFLLGIQLFGKDWKKIEALIGTRNGAQIRSHAQKFFIKVKKTVDQFDKNEESPCPLEINTNVSQNANLIQETEAKNDYSYFFNKIVQKKSIRQANFDFWSLFVDQGIKNKEKQNLNSTFQFPRRKNSFVSLCSETSQCQNIFTTKKIKLQ